MFTIDYVVRAVSGVSKLSIIYTGNSKLKIEEEYFDLVPRPNPDERNSIKQSIVSDGQLNDIIVNEKGIILDGHTRFEILEELSLKPKYRLMKFKTKKDERRFVILSNIARRNLTLFQKCECAWEIYENEKEKALARTYWRANCDPGVIKKGDKVNVPEGFRKEGLAAEVFGKYMGTGHTRVGQIEWLKNNASQETLEELRRGDVSINRAYDLERGLRHIKEKKAWQKKIFGKNKNAKQNHPTICPECQCNTILVKKKPCHVHSKVCCVTCKWGY